VLVLPLAGRPLHHWLLEHAQLSLHLHLTDRLVRHAAAVALTIPERAVLVTAQADRLIYYLPPLPVPGELPKWELGARNAEQEPQPDEEETISFRGLSYRQLGDAADVADNNPYRQCSSRQNRSHCR
jgi:hypothetical protein